MNPGLQADPARLLVAALPSEGNHPRCGFAASHCWQLELWTRNEGSGEAKGCRAQCARQRLWSGVDHRRRPRWCHRQRGDRRAWLPGVRDLGAAHPGACGEHAMDASPNWSRLRTAFGPLPWAHDSTRHADSTPDAPSRRRAARLRGGRVERRPGRLPARLSGWAAALVRWRPVALTGLDPVAVTVGRPPRPAPGHRLGAVCWPGLAGVGDHAKAAAGQRREGFGVVGRSWHGSRLQDSSGSSTGWC